MNNNNNSNETKNEKQNEDNIQNRHELNEERKISDKKRELTNKPKHE